MVSIISEAFEYEIKHRFEKPHLLHYISKSNVSHSQHNSQIVPRHRSIIIITPRAVSEDIHLVDQSHMLIIDLIQTTQWKIHQNITRTANPK